jgi:hypothetical protein
MPVESIIEKERRLVITTAWGRATIDEFMGHQERLLSDPAFSPEFDQLLDGSGVTELAVSSNDVKSFTTTNNLSDIETCLCRSQSSILRNGPNGRDLQLVTSTSIPNSRFL